MSRRLLVGERGVKCQNNALGESAPLVPVRARSVGSEVTEHIDNEPALLDKDPV